MGTGIASALGCMNAPVAPSKEIAEKIGVSKAETAKVLQLLAWGGFVTSRRGYKGGFQLATRADQITTGEVMDFFFSRYRPEPDGDCPIMRALRESIAPGQEAFGSLTLADVAAGRTQATNARLERQV